ncbi:hypothetical protein CDD81_1484 [Ophiocordyceps australis]|uniref:SET domain-containing protein n=1 Tax=Ophiocordyceps australis TaxID=1399860 RepID=A0A2C5YAM5_9HYPO|nr:hypothetical protein CDD81_1484 [Ophiocordyceps australis]
MDAVGNLVRSADEKGVQIMGVAPAFFPGRGLGIMATNDMDEGHVIMTIPTLAIRSLHTTCQEISSKLCPSISLHGLLAAEFALDDAKSADWASLVPQWKHFETSMPCLWPRELQKCLPAEAKRLLAKQCSNFDNDWDKFKKAFAHHCRQDYLYAWLLIGTRAFYYETPTTMALPKHDRLALLPVADFLNHADSGCVFRCSSESYTITTERPYRKGDEIYLSYGDHSNDYLLVEYGFLLGENKWDKVCLDDIILPKLSAEQKRELSDNGPQWQSYIDGEEDVEGTLAKAAKLLLVLLQEYLDSVEEMRMRIRALQIGQECQKDLLEKRWEQMEVMIKEAMATTWFAV